MTDSTLSQREKLLADLEEAVNFVFAKEASDLDQAFREKLVNRFIHTTIAKLSDAQLEEKFSIPTGTQPLENAIELFNSFLENLDEKEGL